MNDRIEDLLELAADDEGRPLPFTAAQMTSRGQAAHRRRIGVTSLAAVGVAAAVVATFAVSGLVTSGPANDKEPAAQPSVVKDPAATDPDLTDAQVLQRCRAAADSVRSAQRQGKPTREEGPTPDLSTWNLDAALSDIDGTTATLVAPDATAYVVCSLRPGTEAETQPGVRVGGVTSLSRGINLRNDLETMGKDAARTFEWNPVCAEADYDQPCPSRIVRGAFERYDAVHRVEVATADGTSVTVDLGKDTWVVRHIEPWVTEGKTPAELQAHAPLTVSLFGKRGQELGSRRVSVVPSSMCFGVGCPEELPELPTLPGLAIPPK